jgi:hypothetical protein
MRNLVVFFMVAFFSCQLIIGQGKQIVLKQTQNLASKEAVADSKTKMLKVQMANYLKTTPAKLDVMGSLLENFNASVEQMNSDKQWMLIRLAEMIKINNSLSDYLAGLNTDELQDAISKVKADKKIKGSFSFKDSLRLTLIEQNQILDTLSRMVNIYQKTTVNLLKKFE